MSQKLKDKVLRNTSMKGMRREREGEKRERWGVGSQNLGCLWQTEGTGSLAGVERGKGLEGCWDQTKQRGTGWGGVGGAELSRMHLTPSVQRGPGEGAGAPGVQGRQRKERSPAPPLPAEPPRMLQASRHRGRGAPAETPAEPAARGTRTRVAGLAARPGQRKVTRF